MSVPRKIMKSYTSADGGICGPLVRRPSVPNERTVGAQAAAHVRSAGTQAHCNAGTVAWSKKRTPGQRHGGLRGVDVRQNALIANVALRDQGDGAAEVRHACWRGCSCRCGRWRRCRCGRRRSCGRIVGTHGGWGCSDAEPATRTSPGAQHGDARWNTRHSRRPQNEFCHHINARRAPFRELLFPLSSSDHHMCTSPRRLARPRKSQLFEGDKPAT